MREVLPCTTSRARTTARLAAVPPFAAPIELAELAGPGGRTAVIGPLDTGALAGFDVSASSIDALPELQADLVAAARLELCPSDDLPWLVDALFAAAGRAVYLAVSPAAAQEPAAPVEFSVRLRAIDSTLRLTGLALLNRTPESEAFDAEFEIAYRVFAPDRVRPPTRSENVATGDSSGG